MNFLYTMMIFPIAISMVGCNTVKSVNPPSNYVPPAQSKEQTGIYEGTYTRRVHGGGFVDGATGKLFALSVNDKFIKKTWEAGEKAINEQFSNITHVKFKGKLSPPPQINNYGYAGTLNIEESIFVKPVQKLIPPDCFKTGVPCSSDGMAAYRK